SYPTGVPPPCSSKLRFAVMLHVVLLRSIEMVSRAPVFPLTQVFLTPPTSLCLSLFAVLVVESHGLLSFVHWFSSLFGCARRDDWGWMMRSAR
ncbi:hypothetical protein C1H46_031382, partial [Malus baccata]